MATAPNRGPPRVARSASLFTTAATARRTLTLPNGLTLVLSAMKRTESAGWRTTWSGGAVSRICDGGATKSPLTIRFPVRILRLAALDVLDRRGR